MPRLTTDKQEQCYQEGGALSDRSRLVETLEAQVLLCGIKLAIECLGNRSTPGIQPLGGGGGGGKGRR